MTPASFPTVPELKQMAAEDIFVRLPANPNLPRGLRGKVTHARHLLRLLSYAVRVLESRQDDRAAARNQATMAGQHGKTALHAIHHRRKAQTLHHQARDKHTIATNLLLAISGAQVVATA